MLEERRSRQSLEALLTNEKKLRKLADEKTAVSRLECSDSCKIKKIHIENENIQLRRELMLLEESKINFEKQNRIYEQEVSYIFGRNLESFV